MFEALGTRITKLRREEDVLGQLTTLVCTSHYGQPEWSGCSEALKIGDELMIEDGNGGPPWKAKVVGLDTRDGWALVEAEDCADRYYAIHPNNGWINNVDCDQSEDPEVVVAKLEDGTYRLQFGLRLTEGWGCL
jgi:hypothetical protein